MNSYILITLSTLLLLPVAVFGYPAADCKCPSLMDKKGDSAHDYHYTEKAGCVRNLTCYQDYETFVVFKWKNSEISQPADSVDDWAFVTTKLDRNAPIDSHVNLYDYFGMICEGNEWYVTKYPLGLIYMDDGGSYLNHDTSAQNEGKKSKIDHWSCELF